MGSRAGGQKRGREDDGDGPGGALSRPHEGTNPAERQRHPRLSPHSYRSLLAIVQQDVFLFDGSVRDNIAYSHHDATDAEVEDAALRANAHEFIAKLPEGYETFIGERGVKLSGGQQQRLAIARAILASPQILIPDEATSNLDTESEQLIQASMATLLAGRATFVIAHRLSTVRRANLTLLMDDGRIIERGTHEDLMRTRGMYHDMVVRQLESQGYDGEAVLR
jgi:ATP-binding cassette subfamily B protein